MNKENLKPINEREDHIELSRKGGLSTSPSKIFSSRLNGLANADLSQEQRYLIALLKDKKYVDIVLELIAQSLTEKMTPKRRDKVIAQIMKLIPQSSINVEINSETNEFNWKMAADLFEKYKRIEKN